VTASLDSKEAQAFRQGLRDAGCTEGRDVVIELRCVDGDYKKVAGLAADLIQRKVDVMVVDTTPATSTSNAPHPLSPSSWRRRRSSRIRPGREPRASRRKRYRALYDVWRYQRQAAANAQGSCPPDSHGLQSFGIQITRNHPNAIIDLKAAALSLSIELRFVSARTREDFDPAFSDVSGAHPVCGSSSDAC